MLYCYDYFVCLDNYHRVICVLQGLSFILQTWPVSSLPATLSSGTAKPVSCSLSSSRDSSKLTTGHSSPSTQSGD